MQEVRKVAEKDFQWWYRWLKEELERYPGRDDEIARTAIIAGFFDGMSPETVFTAAQISEILAIRRPGKEKRAHKSPARREAHQ